MNTPNTSKAAVAVLTAGLLLANCGGGGPNTAAEAAGCSDDFGEAKTFPLVEEGVEAIDFKIVLRSAGDTHCLRVDYEPWDPEDPYVVSSEYRLPGREWKVLKYEQDEGSPWVALSSGDCTNVKLKVRAAKDGATGTLSGTAKVAC